MIYKNPVGYKAQLIRMSFGLSQQKMAVKAGLSVQEYRDFESGISYPEDLPGWYVFMFFS